MTGCVAPDVRIPPMFQCRLTTLPISCSWFRSLSRFFAACGMGAALALPVAALAQAPSKAALPDAPASGSAADDLLPRTDGFDARQKALDGRRAENEYRYGVTVHNCYSKFFVNACLGRARDAMREVDARIHAEQLVLDGERRAERARERDEREALAAAQRKAEAPQRATTDARNAEAYDQKQRQHALDEARRNAEAPQRATNEAAYQRKQSDYQRKLEAARKQAAQDAAERAERAKRYVEKQSAAAQHKADVEARQKQAAQKAEERKQEQLQQQEQQRQLQKEQQDSN
ncbi:colicin transporter [Trinickia caryophylli]|nr:colicin transporter [Trinickia caryophylli]PMS11704.1 colicin transporter [Trinickia caryophylli]TRX17382.1 colicin transporter [Trinickia caryophylli]WQE11876.1 colicin transporter [Trinickia caryophylli]